MKTNPFLQQFFATILSALLVACGTTRNLPPEPKSAVDLYSSVLIIQELPNGHVTHSWQPVESLAPVDHQSRMGASKLAGPIVLTGAHEEECEAEYDLCLARCEGSSRRFQVDHYVYDTSRYGPWRSGKKKYCAAACMEKLAECHKNAGQALLKFEVLDVAVAWLKSHHTEVLAGSIIIIAGVAFVTISGGGGILMLSPLLLMAGSEPPPAPPIPEYVP